MHGIPACGACGLDPGLHLFGNGKARVMLEWWWGFFCLLSPSVPAFFFFDC